MYSILKSKKLISIFLFTCLFLVNSFAAKNMQKKVLIVVAQKDFKDREVFIPRDMFTEQGFSVTIGAIEKKEATGMDGGTIEVDIALNKVKAVNYDLIMIAGGNGVPGTLWENENLQKIVKKAHKKNKLVAAICVAPVILAKAGLLENKNATMYPWDEAIGELTKYGANYTDREVVVVGNVITGRNPEASEAFASKLIELLLQ